MQNPKNYFPWDARFPNSSSGMFLNYYPFSSLLNRMAILSAIIPPVPQTGSLAGELHGLPLGSSSWPSVEIDENQRKSIEINKISTKIKARGFRILWKSLKSLKSLIFSSIFFKTLFIFSEFLENPPRSRGFAPRSLRRAPRSLRRAPKSSARQEILRLALA